MLACGGASGLHDNEDKPPHGPDHHIPPPPPKRLAATGLVSIATLWSYRRMVSGPRSHHDNCYTKTKSRCFNAAALVPTPAAMALKSCLRRTQSLKSVASPCDDDEPARADAAAPREQKASVSRLVARYQNTVEVSAIVEVTQANYSQAKLKQVQQETTTKTAAASAKVVKTAEVSSQCESKAEETNETERSLPHTKTNLTRSRSMGSLQNRPSSIRALKDLFESKNDTPRAKMANATPVVNGPVGDGKTPQKKKAATDATDAPSAKADAKANDGDFKANAKEQERESKVGSPPKETNERERSLPHTKTNLTRSRSMGSLQNRPSSIGALKDLFESKNDTPRAKMAGATPVVNGPVGDGKTPQKKKKAATDATDAPSANADAKANDGNFKANAKEQEVVKKQGSKNRERRRTIGGIDLEKIGASQYEDKRTIADFRDFGLTGETLPISVKAISALYLSKTRAVEQTRNISQLAKDKSECAKRAKPIKSRWPKTFRKQKTIWFHHIRTASGQEGAEERSAGGRSRHPPCHCSLPK
ncbi:hypothetical protein N1851_002982 [Merluccius polli]|uniref:Uncharacterized protein n=1 Tax=Merluccius polli TaxID=89951 RepID=A0AA47NAY4_MERPO|nr:hypothetical protein N1851_002982 [Merluccius polli]